MGIDSMDLVPLIRATAARVESWLAAMDVELPADTTVAAVTPASSAVADATATPRGDVLEELRADPDGFTFTRRLLETVLGDHDPFAAALRLREVSRDLPESMPAREKLALRIGGIASLGLPWAVLPVMRKVAKERLSHLVLLARFPGEKRTATRVAEFRAQLIAASQDETDTLFALTGAQVLGAAGARREYRRLRQLIEQPEVRRVAVDVARLVPPGLGGEWSLDSDAERGAGVLHELLEYAEAHEVTLILEASNYRGALLAPRLLAGSLPVTALPQLRLGIMLPAELPEALPAAQALIAFSKERIAHGGLPLEIGVGSAVPVGREQIASLLSGLAVPTLDSEKACQAQMLRVLQLLLRAGDVVHATLASDDVLFAAAATLIAEHLQQTGSPTLQMRAGIAPELEAAMREHGFRVRRRLPIAPAAEFDGLTDYLVTLAAQSASRESDLARTRSLLTGGAARLKTAQLFTTCSLATTEAPNSHRQQQRELEWNDTVQLNTAMYRPPNESARIDTGGLTAAVLALTHSHTGEMVLDASEPARTIPVVSASGFANEPPTDASRFENRQWVRDILCRVWHGDSDREAAAVAPTSSAGAAHAVSTSTTPAASITTALAAAEQWGAQAATERGVRVSRLALVTASARDRLLETAMLESGAPPWLIDREINGVIDAARYLGGLAGGLAAVRGARFLPDRLCLVVADAAVPMSEWAEAVLAALAAGSAVVLVAHPSVARSAAVLIEEWRAGGLPQHVLILASASESERHDDLLAEYAADTRVDRALVVGLRETAQSMLRKQPGLRIEGRFRERGVVAITPSATAEAAVRDAVASAFGCAHKDASAARVLVLLGGAARSKRLRRALADAVLSVRVGNSALPTEHQPGNPDPLGTSATPGIPEPSESPDISETPGALENPDPLAFDIGPLLEPPGEAGMRALTELDPGEEWLVRPEQLDQEGRLWRPGVRIGIRRGARFWDDARGMPVIGVIAAQTVDEMISLCNELSGGGVAALHSNHPDELLPWLERTAAAALFVGRPTTGAKVERQPGGGWGAAGMGIGTLAGGPSRLVTLGSWELREGTASPTLHLRGLSPEVRVLIETAQVSLDYQSFDRLRRAALADALTWRTQLGGVHDVTGLGIERNLIRRWPIATQLRLAEGGAIAELLRVIAAGLVARAPMCVSTGEVLPQVVTEFLSAQGISVALERDQSWLERMAVTGPGDEMFRATRVRLIGGDRVQAAEWLAGAAEVSLWAEPVTMAGPVELLALLREQAISISAHRHGLSLPPSGVAAWIAELQSRV